MTAAKPGSAKRATKGGTRRGSTRKYNAKGEHIVLNGKPVWIPSAAQAVRLRQLIVMQEQGLIENLRAEVPVDLVVNKKRICRYRCDHVYDLLDVQGRSVRTVWEDVKGLLTPDFKLKHKLFDALMAPEHLSLIAVPNWNERSKYMKDQGLKASHFSIEEWFATNWSGRVPD